MVGDRGDKLEQYIKDNTKASDSEVDPAYSGQLFGCMEMGTRNTPLHCTKSGCIFACEEPSCRNERPRKTSHSLEALTEIEASSRILRSSQNCDIGICSNLESR